jgi:hypothetical protein
LSRDEKYSGSTLGLVGLPSIKNQRNGNYQRIMAGESTVEIGEPMRSPRRSPSMLSIASLEQKDQLDCSKLAQTCFGFGMTQSTQFINSNRYIENIS